MTTQQIGLLAIQLIVSLSVMASIGVLLLQNHEAKQKYKLYAVRDRLLYLAVTGKLAQTDMLFKVFYRAMNVYAARVEDLSFFSFVKASRSEERRVGEGCR